MSINDEKERLKYCFAKYCWSRKNERAPSKEKVGEVTRYVTWAEVFKRHYGQSLDEYRSERRRV